MNRPSNGRTLVVVPGERHVERLLLAGVRAETRTALRSRLVRALLPEVAFADRDACRLMLGMALAEVRGQLGLFAEQGGDPVIEALRSHGGASWVRAVAALDDAIGSLRQWAGDAALLERVARAPRVGNVVATRARTLAVAIRVLDDALLRARMSDPRGAGRLLADAVTMASADSVERLLGARTVRSRWIFDWDPGDLGWWRALDEKLAIRGGGAKVVLFAFDRPLEPTRERDPFERISEEVAAALDAAPETELIRAVLGELGGKPTKRSLSPRPATQDATPEATPAVRVSRVQDPPAQAQATADVVGRGLDGGAAIERVVVACAALDEGTLAPVREALEEAGIPFHDARGPSPARTPVVVTALLALEAATSLDRNAVARLLASGYVDPAEATRRDLATAARALSRRPTAEGVDETARLVATVGTADKAGVVARVAAILTKARRASTRAERIAAARTLFVELGIAAHAGRGGLEAFARDEAPAGVPRAERRAIARDARAWETLVGVLDRYESCTRRTATADRPVDADVFLLELTDQLEASSRAPGAGRSGAVRIARLADVAGEELDLLVVIDANDGLLPRDARIEPVLSEALAREVGRAMKSATATDATAAGARDLAALATAAADAKVVHFLSPREDRAGTPLALSPFLEPFLTAPDGADIAPPRPLLSDPGRLADVRRRVATELARESFFLDPMRPLSPLVGALSDEARPEVVAMLASSTGDHGRALAVTSLERFAQCAFAGYAHVVLAAREPEIRQEIPDAREEGIVLHRALAAAFEATRALWLERPRRDDAIALRAETASEAALAIVSGHAPLRAVVRLRIRDAVRAVLQRALRDEVWDFALAEQAFGSPTPTDHDWPSFTIADATTSVTLRGTIDRIDKAHDGMAARVIDYKRSRNTVRDSLASLGETALQVPLYACVAAHNLGVVASGTYAVTQPRDIQLEGKGGPRAEAKMQALLLREGAALSPVEARAVDLVKRVRAGGLVPLPVVETICRRCAVSGGCRKPRFAMTPLEESPEEA